MKMLYIVKLGTTFPATAEQFGDFDKWTVAMLGPVDIETCVLDAEHGAALPAAADCAGVILTASHSMVTDDLPWSVKVEEWIRSLLETRTPLLGICYGHQLLARAAGGRVGFHPSGKEIGTVAIQLHPACANDPLFQGLPQSFFVHVTHLQTVQRLPSNATCLAANAHEPNQAFRLWDCAWGVQFHPEFDADVMRSYVKEQADELKSAGLDVAKISGEVADAPFAAKTLRNFARFVEGRLAKKANAGDGK